MKTTEEMHQKYYDKLFEQTGLTPECLDYMDVIEHQRKVQNFNQGILPFDNLRLFANNKKILNFAMNEEQRVNKKWRKRNERKD